MTPDDTDRNNQSGLPKRKKTPYEKVNSWRLSLKNAKVDSNPFMRILIEIALAFLYVDSLIFVLFFGRGIKPKSPLREWINLIVSIVIIVFFIRLLVVEAFRIPTGSMEDTMLVGDFLLVNKFIYGIRSPDWIGIPFTKAGFFIPFFRIKSFREPRQGDIVVFRFPQDKNLSYIKRCVATEGQTVEIREKNVYVDGVLFQNPPNSKFSTRTYPVSFIDNKVVPKQIEMRNRDNYGPVTVPEEHLFVMGDNRDNSSDSRFWGFLDRDLIIGKALIIYFSWDKTKPFMKMNLKIRWERIGNLIR